MSYKGFISHLKTLRKLKVVDRHYLPVYLPLFMQRISLCSPLSMLSARTTIINHDMNVSCRGKMVIVTGQAMKLLGNHRYKHLHRKDSTSTTLAISLTSSLFGQGGFKNRNFRFLLLLSPLHFLSTSLFFSSFFFFTLPISLFFSLFFF